MEIINYSWSTLSPTIHRKPNPLYASLYSLPNIYRCPFDYSSTFISPVDLWSTPWSIHQHYHSYDLPSPPGSPTVSGYSASFCSNVTTIAHTFPNFLTYNLITPHAPLNFFLISTALSCNLYLCATPTIHYQYHTHLLALITSKHVCNPFTTSIFDLKFFDSLFNSDHLPSHHYFPSYNNCTSKQSTHKKKGS